MSTEVIIALAIVLISLIVIIVAGFMGYKKAQPALKNIQKTREDISDKMAFYNREVNHINERVDDLNNRVTVIQADAEVKAEQFQDLTDESGKFQTSLTYLKDHAGEYASGISSNVKDEWKEDGPKITETFKRAFKKTAQKQKVRYQK